MAMDASKFANIKDKARKMIHADIGAVVCKEWFNFSDEMCNAIKYHTVANEVMTLVNSNKKSGSIVVMEDSRE